MVKTRKQWTEPQRKTKTSNSEDLRRSKEHKHCWELMRDWAETDRNQESVELRTTTDEKVEQRKLDRDQDTRKWGKAKQRLL